MAVTVDFRDSRIQGFVPPELAVKLYAPDSISFAASACQLGARTQLLDYQARIDNRQSLAVSLGIAACDAESWPTGDLLLRAYQRWGSEMTAHLRGDWWFAMWDGALRQLVLAVDPTGPTPVFYTHRNGQFAFAASLVELLRLPGMHTGLCEPRMLSYLLRWIAYPDYEQTEYEGIFQLRPACCLHVDHAGVRRHTYWRASDWQPSRRYSDQDYLAQFLQLFRKAVAVRIAGRQQIASMLSAGLDSGSVTTLAAQELAARGQTLSAFTHVPIPEVSGLHLPGKIIDEWPLAHATALRSANVQHVAVQSAALSPLVAYQRGLRMTGRLQSTVANMPWIHQLYTQVQQQNMDLLLCGQLGNLVVTWEGVPESLWTQLKQRKWGSAWANLLSGETFSAYHLLRGVARHGWRTMRPDKGAQRMHFAGLAAHPAHSDLLRRYQPEFEAHPPMHTDDDARNQRARVLPLVIASTGFNSLLASAYGMTMSDPTADQDLIEFCLSAPDDVFARDGKTRWLIRQAMQDILPPEVQWNRVRGLQPADSAYRFLAHRDQVEAMLDIMQRSSLAQHYLDVARIRQCWQGLQATLRHTADYDLFQQGIAMGCFFAHLEGADTAGDISAIAR